MFVFDLTYLIRAGFLVFLRLDSDLYIRLWSEKPFLIATCYIVVQMLYDVVPLVLIFKQHYDNFGREDDRTTEMLLRTTHTETTFDRETYLTRTLTMSEGGRESSTKQHL